MTMPPVVLITGAARRIGAATARMLHADGWRVVVHAHRSIDVARELVAELCARRADSATALAADLNDPAQIDALAQAAQARWGRLDALVNNASTYYPTPLGTITAAQIDDLVASNLRAPLLLTQACAALMGEGAQVINIIDVHARRPLPGYAAYCAAKAGLWALTESLAQELAPRVRVNAVAPGHMIWATNSSMSAEQQAAEVARIPVQRLGGREEIARAVRFLLSDGGSYLNGAVIPVDGGLRLS
ncbi:MAG: pteridine reductase [Nevskiales bacterium]|nr:pteridine reductase [Nevskiales bacterium]